LGLTNTGSDLTSLFQTQPRTRRGFPSFAISTVLHGIGIVLLGYGLLHRPVIAVDPISRNYKVRHLDLHVPETAASRAAEALYPQTKPTAEPQKNQELKPAADSAEEQTAQTEPRPRAVPAIKLPEGGEGKQILVQPEVHAHIAMAEEAPLPTVMVWAHEIKPTDKIVPPPPDKPSTVDVQTSFVVPNEELELADMPQTAADHPPVVKTAPAGNSTPIAVKAPSDVKKAPSTASTPSTEPAAAAVLSVTDMRMNEGTVALPPANETKGATHNDGGAAGQNGIGQPAHVAGQGNGATGAAKQAGTTVADAQKSGQSQFAAGETAQHIQLPKDGKFGVVVVGSSLSDQYPETLQIWSDRVAYTAYLHIGTAKAWILQYAQMRSADAGSGGTVAHLDAPWPFDIQRPDVLSKDLNADALMVHGVLNDAGRLENLAIAYPEGYVHARFVLAELRQWQFRPARQLGKAVPVEVLLIIPEQTD
jgi:hypothetical protein